MNSKFMLNLFYLVVLEFPLLPLCSLYIHMKFIIYLYM